MPPDTPKDKRYTWVRARSHAWVEQALQSRLVVFLTVFADEHGWVRKGTMRLEERFTDTGVNVKVPTGPTAPAQRKDNFLQRTGEPHVVVSCIRDRDGRLFEVGIPFPLGNDTPPNDAALAQARLSLRQQEKESR